MATLDLTWIIGDSKDVPLQLLDDATPAVPYALTDPVVIKWSVKDEADDSNDDALFEKVNRTSSVTVGADEIEITDIPNGRIKLKARKADTVDADPKCYCHDVELTRAGEELTAAETGTVSVTSGDGAVVGTGTKFTLLHVGDMVLLTSTHNENKVPVLVEEITDDEHMHVDYLDWFTESGIAVSKAFIGDVKTPFIGKVTLTQDVTR